MSLEYSGLPASGTRGNIGAKSKGSNLCLLRSSANCLEKYTMTPEASVSDKAYINRAVEASIHIGLAVLLAIACLMIVKPFLPLLAWGSLSGSLLILRL